MEKISHVALSECRNLLSSDGPSYSSIVIGESKGDVWIDNLSNPTLALVYSPAVGGFSIMGDPDDTSVFENLKEFLTNDLFSMLKRKGINDFEFSVESERTMSSLLNLFSDRVMSQEVEYFYRKSSVGKVTETDQYYVLKIDTDFITQLQSGCYDNPELLTEKLLGSWETIEKFLSRSVGYVAIHEKSIVALIIGTARFQNVIPIDIETNENHRKNGLALTLTQYFVNECIERGLIAQWNCVESNIGSRKTVEKAGFDFMKKKTYYWFDI
ncbi:MAG: GNAT family N-acetyltransferase [Clostridiales bacterium]|nr:GNAT family N-acetyltransferase [Clostridiales bacterium]